MRYIGGYQAERLGARESHERSYDRSPNREWMIAGGLRDLKSSPLATLGSG